ncbi:MAG TPA: GTP 3',8-cyclase MoaA [Methanocorpusculum sp.]|nr:GTP 3',8-cyclase MoaA [Methanocorpusculum sp.]
MNCSCPMTDPFGRKITDVRIAVNSACNLNCLYCHSEGEGDNGCVRSPAHTRLSAVDVGEITCCLADLGVTTIKLTGGEPLLCPDICDIIRAIPSSIQVSLTTNGTLLAEKAADLKAAGLTRVNISIDSLDPDRYAKITGKNMLDKVLNGLDAAVAAGLTPIKINMVILPGINDDEIDDFIRFVQGKEELILQVIELMDLNGWANALPSSARHSSEIVENLEERLKSEAEEVVTRRMHHRRKYYLDKAAIEIVRPMHNAEFCRNCNRLRITSDKYLKPCLLQTGNEISLDGLHGDEIPAAIAKAVAARKPYFT